MGAASILSTLQTIPGLMNHPPARGGFITNRPTSHVSSPHVRTSGVNKTAIDLMINRSSLRSFSGLSAAVVNDISDVTIDPAQAEITWQIVIGALAGVVPFVVAGIEFSKRIVEQRQCKVCKGSGLVLRDKKYYFRCPRCGGFLPWQSWRRFFTG